MKRKLPEKETILQQLRWRYAVKQFDPEKKISEDKWSALERAMILAPSSYGLQPYIFAVVTDQKVKEKLLPAAYGQTQITDCSHLVVFAARKVLDDDYVEEYADRIREVRGEQGEEFEDYIGRMKDSMKKKREEEREVTWSQRQAYLALGFLLETAALLEIDACPMEGFDPEKVDEILGLEDYTASALCALGYRSEDDWLADLEKVRFTKERLVRKIDQVDQN